MSDGVEPKEFRPRLRTRRTADGRRAAGQLAANAPVKRGPRPHPRAAELKRQQQEIARLHQRLAQAETIIAAQKNSRAVRFESADRCYQDDGIPAHHEVANTEDHRINADRNHVRILVLQGGVVIALQTNTNSSSSIQLFDDLGGSRAHALQGHSQLWSRRVDTRHDDRGDGPTQC